MRTAFVTCTGCEQRDMDAERVKNYLLLNGLDLVESPNNADLSIVVTCAVDERNERLSLAAVRKVASAMPKNGRLLVGGCLPSISPGEIADLDHTPFSPRSLESLDDVLGASAHIPMASVPDPNLFSMKVQSQHGNSQSTARAEYEAAKRGFKIRINHGCRLSCSYCVIRLATGMLESVPIETVIRSFEKAINLGEPTIMLMGGDTGAYGLDIGTSFSSLLERLFRFDGEHKIHIHDLNINWIIRDLPGFQRVLQTSLGRLRTASIPIQSGSDRLLKAMRRPYRSNEVREALEGVRQAAPDLLIGTHIIVGFPGELDEDFEETLSLIEDVAFDFVTCFPYSEHAAAPSKKLLGKVSVDDMKSRLDRVSSLLGPSATILR